MNIKSLLLGSAAALAAVSGAQAADAIVAAEPEPMEYVRVCDAFGTGFFYIPGTETCLKIGGFVRFQVSVGDDADIFGLEGAANKNTSSWDAGTMAYLSVEAKSETEYGTLTGFIGLEADNDDYYYNTVSNPFYTDEAYIQLGGFKVGQFYGPWDKGINGETDDIASNTNFNTIAYTYEGGAFSATASVEELENLTTNNNGVGVTGLVTAALGGVSIDLLGSYDTEAEEGAIRALLSADLGPGTLQVAGIWASDPNAYYNEAEWTVAASYAFKATDKLTITPGAQYWSDRNFVSNDDQWKVGLTLDYAVTEGLNAKATVNYQDRDSTGDSTTGFLRLQRNF